MTDDTAYGSTGQRPGKEGEPRDIRVYLQRQKEQRNVRIGPDHKLTELLAELDIPPDGIIAFTAGCPIPLDDVIWDYDEITIVTVSSGG
ncbi:MAG: hypothetical protein ACMUIG_08055 [Thermoplasmatota archaeon]